MCIIYLIYSNVLHAMPPEWGNIPNTGPQCLWETGVPPSCSILRRTQPQNTLGQVPARGRPQKKAPGGIVNKYFYLKRNIFVMKPLVTSFYSFIHLVVQILSSIC